MSLDYLRTRMDQNEVAFIYDEIGDRGFGMLRCLPVIHYLGVHHFTFPKRWRQLSSPAQYDYLDYEYELLGEIDLRDEMLCAITNQNYETHTEFTIRPLLHRYESSEATFVVIADHHDFDPQEGQRMLRMQPFVYDMGSYRQVYSYFEDHYEEVGVGCPLIDTANLFMQDNANLYRMVTGQQLTRTRELFEVLPDAPYLPLYEAFVQIFSRRREPGASPLDSFAEIEGLGRWLRRRLEWDRQKALEVARSLNRRVDADESTFDSAQRSRHPMMEEATSVARTIDSTESDVHERYMRWLSEVVQ